MRARLSEAVVPSIYGMRSPAITDIQALGALMLCAYRGAVDYEGESEIEAVAEVERTFAGEHSTLSLPGSRLSERDNAVVSAALIASIDCVAPLSSDSRARALRLLDSSASTFSTAFSRYVGQPPARFARGH